MKNFKFNFPYNRRHIMAYIENSGGYESMVWVQDKDGREFACYMKDLENPKELADEEKAKCLDVNSLIGTERW